MLDVFDLGPDGDTGTEAVIHESFVVPLSDEPRRSISPGRALTWLATGAAVVLAALAVSRGALLPDAANGDGLTITDPSGTLQPGRQRTTVIADGLSFDAPPGMVMIGEEPGLVVLTTGGGGTSDGQLVIVEVPATDWEAELGALAEAGEVNLKELLVTAGGQPATRWDVTVSSQAVADRSCDSGEPCIRLTGWPADGPASLYAGADNRIVELARTGDSVVVAIEVSQRFTGPLSRLAAQVINTAEVAYDG